MDLGDGIYILFSIIPDLSFLHDAVNLIQNQISVEGVEKSKQDAELMLFEINNSFNYRFSLT